MSIIKAILNILSAALTVYLQLVLYAKMSDRKPIKINFKAVLIFIFCGILVYLNTILNTSLSRIVVNYLIILLSALYIYKDSMNKTFVYTTFTYIILTIYEILLALVVVNVLKITNMDKDIIFKTLFSLFIMLIGYYTVSIKIIKEAVSKFILNKDLSLGIYSFFIVVLILLILIDYKSFRITTSEMYISNLVILGCTIANVVFAMYNYLKANREVKKAEVLLDFIKKYERLIENDRMLRHEMLNNLLTLNSYDNKNSEEYNNILKELIETYNKSGMKIKNLHKLPSGVRGLIYCKLSGLEEKGFHINIRIPKNIPSAGKILDNKNYALLCKLMGIVIDNAVEAAEKSKDKSIDLEVIKERKGIFVYMSNSCDNKVDMKRLDEKYYSTKGKKRGLGLYIAKNIVKNNEHIFMHQEMIDKIFTTRITIK